MFFDPLYLLMIAPALLLSVWAQFKVKRNFARYQQVPSSSGLSGAQVAQRILRGNGIHDVAVEEVQGFLSDHYDPAHRVLRLSPAVFRGQSVAAAGIAAHEAGHALQHAQAYAPLRLRSALVPAASLGSNLSWILIMAGLLIQWTTLAWVGIALFSAAVLFSLVTLPVEFDASRRAKAVLPALGLVSPADQGGVSAVLNAAAMTYVAAAAAAILQLLYFVLRVMGSSRD
ncbi:MAG TPA: zinc metallopeptidase [Myxococcota bacterium]|nr:zinc metallopeptidase [Myxococcota bacterium]HQK50828.1 zinc metallopeptidase [Myxococcota bacterium]